MTRSAATADIVALIPSLGYDEQQTTALVQAVRAMPRGYEFRALAVPSIDALVGGNREPYASIRRQIEVPRPFSFMPTTSFFLLLLAAGRTLFPELSARDACRKLACESARTFATSIYGRPILRSAEGDFGRFAEMQAKMPDFFQNFSSVDFVRVSRTHVRLHYTDSLSVMAGEFVLPGFWQGMFETFGVNGEVTTVVYGPHSFDLELRW